MDDIRNIIITEIFDIVLSAIILKIYFKTFFTEKEVKYIRVYIPTIMYIGWQILLMRGIELPVYCKMLISTILITIICLSAFIGSFALKLVFSLLICVIWTMMEFIVGCFVGLISVNYVVPQIVGIIVSKLLTLFLIILVRSVFKNENIQNLSKEYSVLLLLIPIGSMYVVYNLFMLSGNSEHQIFTSLVGLGIMLLINVIIFRVILKLSDESELRRENTVYAQQLELCNNHMKEKESVMLEFRNARHDMKHHFIVMLKMIEKKEFNNLSDYLAALVQENRYEKLGISRTDNIVIDALINAKYIYAQKNGIHFDVQINVPIQLPFENADISILLGNILDNAFEASIQLPVSERFVELLMRLENNTLCIALKNRYNGFVVRDKNGNMLTTKGDAQNHGIGLKSVYRITNKYHGSIVIDDSVNMFTVKIMLCDI
ncbi:GHKL domain-containing protein [Mediterraneibacter gnavus]|uniref:GHKL domain-containing protein n=1 Tax=Mediterraneibacter gnavus TaxID=33038 RepID=UPI00366AB9AC